MTGIKFRMIFSASGSANSTETLTPEDPSYDPGKFAQNQGQSRVTFAGRGAVQPSEIGRSGGEQLSRRIPRPTTSTTASSSPELFGTPFEITVYKLGDKYYGARSNEFGYANYEIIPPIKELNPLTVLR